MGFVTLSVDWDRTMPVDLLYPASAASGVRRFVDAVDAWLDSRDT